MGSARSEFTPCIEPSESRSKLMSTFLNFTFVQREVHILFRISRNCCLYLHLRRPLNHLGMIAVSMVVSPVNLTLLSCSFLYHLLSYSCHQHAVTRNQSFVLRRMEQFYCVSSPSLPTPPALFLKLGCSLPALRVFKY